jgi:hypothetical protein
MLIQSFTRRAIWLILLALGLSFALVIYFWVYKNQLSLALHMTAYSQIMLTLVFMMMGIELRREQRRVNMDDMIAVYSKRTGAFPLIQVLVLGLLDLVVTLLLMAGCLLCMKMDGAPALWISQTLAYIVLLYFLPCWILGVWGLLIAQWNKGKSVYLPAMLVWLMTSTLFAELLFYAQAIGLGNGGFLLNMINMGIINFHIPGNFVAGAPIEMPYWIVRTGIMILLIALFLSVYAVNLAATRSQKRWKWIGMISVIVCSVALMTFFNLRYSVFFARFADPDVVHEYVWSKHRAYAPGEPVSLADYPVEKLITLVKTDIDLCSTTQGIKAEVTMNAILDTQANGQSFTLYSDLVVDDVLVDGETAAIERSCDGLMVYFPSAKNAGDQVTFIFRYHGYSLPVYPANETTVQLNRAFPWIPWPGIKIYHDYYIISESESFFIEDWQRGDEVAYTLRYQGPGNVYTNLTKEGDGLYKGMSDNGVSLYSGMVHYCYREVDVYVPASQYQSAYWAVNALLDAYDPLLDLCERMETIRKPEKPRTIVLMHIPCPMINEFIIPQEPYSWNDEWEIRQYNDSSGTALLRRRYADDLAEYQSSMEVMAQMAVAYLLTPCTGYPIDVSYRSTSNYAAFLSMYVRASRWDDPDQDYDNEYFDDLLRTEFSGINKHSINGIYVTETPLTKEEKNWIDDILDRMRAGENFDAPFKALYQRLLQSEMVTVADIVSELYNNQGE